MCVINIQLKSCPFCGGTPKFNVVKTFGLVFVECSDCGASSSRDIMPQAKSVEDQKRLAAEYWNKRVL